MRNFNNFNTSTFQHFNIHHQAAQEEARVAALLKLTNSGGKNIGSTAEDVAAVMSSLSGRKDAGGRSVTRLARTAAWIDAYRTLPQTN